ncbi:MAG: hypothetical protein CMJ84_05335 [Planctomycetes bacterium]|nr:hypothetical protein [Planctomycetota bacterium]
MLLALAPRRLAPCVTLATALFSAPLLAAPAFPQGLSARAIWRPGDLNQLEAIGPRTSLVLRVRYPGEQDPISDPAAQSSAMDMIESIDRNSWSVTSSTVDITPTFEMPQPASFYSNSGNGTVLLRIRADAHKLARIAGFEPEDYDHDIIISRNIWNGAPGLGTINYRTVFVAGGGGWLWGHELGHALGWGHASGWTSENADPISPTGNYVEYGDQFDMMGNQGIPSIPRAFHHCQPRYKLRAGWLPSSSVIEVNAPGSFQLQDYSQAPSSVAPSALLVRRDADTDYWIFWRADEARCAEGPVIVRANRNPLDGSELIDLHPMSAPLPGGGAAGDLLDSAMAPGEAFWDQAAGIEIVHQGFHAGLLQLAVSVPGSQSLLDERPVIDVVAPARGRTLRGRAAYRATAFDPDVGRSDGAGIDKVRLELLRLDGHVEGPPVVDIVRDKAPYFFVIDTADPALGVIDGKYILRVTATADDGGVSANRFLNLIDNTGPSF